MTRPLLLASLLAVIAGSVYAQAPAIEDLRPEGMQFPDNLGMEELPIGIAPAPPAPVLPGPASADDHDGLTILSGELASNSE